MARGRYQITEKRIKRFLKEGRGQGRGCEYKPWLTIRDVPSSGRSHRIFGITTGRIHHLLSDQEKDLFYLLDWQKTVVDIREQYPLDREQTKRISDCLSIRHPHQPGVIEPMVMTTDFVVDYRYGSKIETLAYAVKSADDLERPRTIEKLEIEKKYWEIENVEWRIVTRDELPSLLVKNIAWVHPMFDGKGISNELKADSHKIIDQMVNHSSWKLAEFCREMDTRSNRDAGQTLLLMRHLIANRIIECDMENVELSGYTEVNKLMSIQGVTLREVV